MLVLLQGFPLMKIMLTLSNDELAKISFNDDDSIIPNDNTQF